MPLPPESIQKAKRVFAELGYQVKTEDPAAAAAILKSLPSALMGELGQRLQVFRDKVAVLRPLAGAASCAQIKERLQEIAKDHGLCRNQADTAAVQQIIDTVTAPIVVVTEQIKAEVKAKPQAPVKAKTDNAKPAAAKTTNGSGDFPGDRPFVSTPDPTPHTKNPDGANEERANIFNVKDYIDVAASRRAEADGTSPPQQQPLQWLDMSNWDSEPVPQRKWAIKDRVPLNQVGLFSGEGGTGKSIIELMKNVAHVAGKDWLGSMPELGPAIYLGAEDDTDEIHIRLAAIAKHYGVTFKQLTDGGLHVLPLLGKDATLCAVRGKSGRVEVTGLYNQIYEAAGDIKPINISVDTLSRAFAGSEIDRVQVYAFAMHMQALAMVAGGAVTVLSHPSLAGIASGSGISGSTAWHGAFRFRHYLKSAKAADGEQPENDIRELEFKKNQYGPIGETSVLRYQRGLFLPEAGVGGLDKLARDARAEEIFMDLLGRLSTQGRNVSDKATSPNYAPAAFAKEADAKKHNIRKPELDAAMRRLFDTNKIHVETYGRPSRPYSKLAIKSSKGNRND